MGGWKHFGIGARLAGAFAAMVALLAVVAGFGLIALGDMNASMRTTVEQRLLKVMELDGVKEGAQAIGIMVRDAVLTEDPAVVQQNVGRVNERRKQMSATLDDLSRLIAASDNPGLKQVFDELGKHRAAYNAQLDQLLTQLQAGEFVAARAGLIVTLPAAQAAYFERLDTLIASGRKMATEAVQQAQADYLFTRNLLLALGAVSALLAVGLAVAITRSIAGPARQALAAAEALAQGDLAFAIRAKGDDEMGRMLKAMQRAFAELSVLVRGIQSASGAIDGATREIAKGNTDLSQRTEEQAASLEQTAASMEQLTSTVRQNADNARQANQLAVNASAVAAEGGRTVRSVVETMQGISQSSAKVAEIIGVIEGIAFQTNILALNAAVEAARAGEQGRGFSVVAAEVRSLAQRSAAAAKEIGELINRSVEQVEVGARQVEQAGGTMDGIVEAVRRVTDIMGEISAASAEQSTGIEQVNRAIAQMESVTQQNAALVEQAAAAAESLQQQAAGLVQDAAKFRVEEATVALSRATAPAREPMLAVAAPIAKAAPGAKVASAASPASLRAATTAPTPKTPAVSRADGAAAAGAKSRGTPVRPAALAAAGAPAAGADDWQSF
ncbi:methyl-accepting chemotaxis protein [Cupriavidus sp. UGS-1]|uniref:methyl-accepting chemotaxis protein n=1 Tax=Cupriavidus sp. UGS-1 TaxID=2899826 RepID=UPI001E2B5755|nr:methyl-accepting chemotaxis protein [Cupriavidus sp. UGS-1]MCD9120864.1 methyl-accepting chemotaxis protein [Cupriavidus sp. UGS-1]